MYFLKDYNRKDAVMYAHRWAYGRNPAYYDYGCVIMGLKNDLLPSWTEQEERK